MKKVTLFAVVAVAALSLVSCKKDHTCTCTDNSSGTAVVVTTKAKSTKKDAAAWCTGSTSVTTPTPSYTEKFSCVMS